MGLDTIKAKATGKPDYVGEVAVRVMQNTIAQVKTDYARFDRDKQDWLNLLFYRGGEDNQWITWDQVDNVWRRIPSDDAEFALPSWVPRAASNVFTVKIDGIVSLLNQSMPAQEYRPANDEDKALATADVVDAALPALRDEVEWDSLRSLINLHCALTDKCAVLIGFDNNEKYGTDQIQAYACRAPGCGQMAMPTDIQKAGDTCPSCGAPADSMEPALDGQGNPVGVQYPVGKLYAKLYPSFEMSLPPDAREVDETKVRWVLLHQQMGREEAAELFPHAAAFIKNAKSEYAGYTITSQYAAAMRNISSPHSAARGVAAYIRNSVLVWRLYHDPFVDTESGIEYPQGLYVTMIDGEVIEGGPLPLKDDKGRPIKPLVLRSYRPVAGTPFGKPPADDLVSIQRQRNLVETLILLCLMHNAAPRTFVPLTVSLEDEITGQPQQTIRYRSFDGQKPFTEPGISPPDGLFKMLEILDRMADEISGMNAILQGEQPQGSPTLGEIQILQERGMSVFKTPLDGLTEFEKRISYLLLQTARQSLWAPRFLRIKGDNDQWEVKSFMAADLEGSIDIYINPSSAWPKSQLLQHLRVQDAAKLGILNPHDPEISLKLLSDYGLTHLKPSLDHDRKQIARELDKWKAAQSPQDVRPPQFVPGFSAAMHLQYKSTWMKTEEAEQLRDSNPPVWQAMLAHLQLLTQMIQPPQPVPPKPPTAPQVRYTVSDKGLLADPSLMAGFKKTLESEGVSPPPPQQGQPPGPPGMPPGPGGPPGMGGPPPMGGPPMGGPPMGPPGMQPPGMMGPPSPPSPQAQGPGPSVEDLIAEAAAKLAATVQTPPLSQGPPLV